MSDPKLPEEVCMLMEMEEAGFWWIDCLLKKVGLNT